MTGPLVLHFKRFLCGDASWRALGELQPGAQLLESLRLPGWWMPKSPGLPAGGIVLYRETETRKDVDPETLEEVQFQDAAWRKARFELYRALGLVQVQGPRAAMHEIAMLLDSVPNANIALEDLNLSLHGLCLEICNAYPRHALKNIKIRDYLARENMLATARFKILEDAEAAANLDRFAAQLDAFTLTLKLPEGPLRVTVDRKGTLRAGEDCPDDVVAFVRDMLPRFHDQAVVETTAVHDPSGVNLAGVTRTERAVVAAPMLKRWKPGAGA